MRYLLSKEFIQINETTGTIQNASRIYSVEIFDKAQAKSGFLLPPLNKISFVDKTLYARCTDDDFDGTNGKFNKIVAAKHKVTTETVIYPATNQEGGN